MARYFDAMRAALERHGGSVEKFIGDAVMAVFGIPQLHEDDALRAVRAAVDMRAALDGPQPRARTRPRRSARLPDRREHRRGARRRRCDRLRPRHRRRREHGRPARGRRRPGRDPDRRRDVSPRPRRGRGGTRRAALAQGEGRARPRPPSARGRLGVRAGPPRAPVHDGGPRPGARGPHARVRPRRRGPELPAVHRAGGRGRGQDAAGGGIPRLGGRVGQRGERPLPAVRRGDHVLAGGRSRSRCPGRSGVRRARGHRCPSGSPGRGRRARGRDRASPRGDPRRRREHRRRRGSAVGDPSVLGDPGGRTTARRAVGGHPLGRARVPRRHRPRRGLVARRADHARVHGAAGVSRYPSRTGAAAS